MLRSKPAAPRDGERPPGAGTPPAPRQERCWCRGAPRAAGSAWHRPSRGCRWSAEQPLRNRGREAARSRAAYFYQKRSAALRNEQLRLREEQGPAQELGEGRAGRGMRADGRARGLALSPLPGSPPCHQPRAAPTPKPWAPLPPAHHLRATRCHRHEDRPQMPPGGHLGITGNGILPGAAEPPRGAVARPRPVCQRP